MACVALTSLLATIQLEFLQPIPRVSLHDDAQIKSFFGTLSSFQAFLQPIPRMSLHDDAEIKSFFGTLSSLQAFLNDEANYHGAAIKDLETKIRDYALKAEDDIETQLSNFLLAKDKEYREKASQELHQTVREAAENAAELLKVIYRVLDEANRWLKHASDSENFMSGASPRCSLKLEDRIMVGRSHDCERIKYELFGRGVPDSRNELRVISIAGMAGIGKTTLVRSVFGDPLVASEFNFRAWITVTQEYSMSKMIRELLQSITPTTNEINKEKTLLGLQEEVRKRLMAVRFLIVLDDVWSFRIWDDIKPLFIGIENGSRILLTTRDYGVAQCASSYNSIHTMSLLDYDESWDLFCNILPLKKYTAPTFENIRSDVVERCEGLPQAIVAVAERLSKCNNIQQEWKKIKKELESLGILDHNALTLSYNQLPQHLKVCFLYLGVFPKHSEIPVKMLIRLWIAEGFLNHLEDELENHAHWYLQELTNRSLVLIVSMSFDGKIKTCRVHTALHSFCVGEAQKEGILCAVNTRQNPELPLSAFANSCRWLSLYTHSFDYYVLFSTNNPRSIFFFHENPEMFLSFKLLRVLAFVPSSFLQRVPMHLGDLVFLRYISVTHWFEGLDYIVSANPNLQTLVVSGKESQLGAPTLNLPSKIWKAPRLRHLELGNLYTVDPPSVDKENLQTLSWVNPTHCRKEVCYRFPKIRKLKIFYKDDFEPSHTRVSCSNAIILDNLDYLKWLEKLSISVLAGRAVTLPEWPMFPSRLKKLRLSGTNLSERDLTVIGMLPKLMVLKLENAFHGKVWKVAEGGFCRLGFLLLETRNLEKLIATGGSFPCLERLALRFCYCLEEIPRGFADIFNLRSIELERCCPSVITSAKHIREGLESRSRMCEINILGPEYDESKYTPIEKSVKDDLAGLTVN